MLESAQGGAGLEEAKAALRGRLLPHCADESGAGQLGPADVKILMDYLTSTVLNHYVLYQHVFTVPQETETHEKTLVVQRADLLEPLGTAELEQPPQGEPVGAGPEETLGAETTPEEAGGRRVPRRPGAGGRGRPQRMGRGPLRQPWRTYPRRTPSPSSFGNAWSRSARSCSRRRTACRRRC